MTFLTCMHRIGVAAPREIRRDRDAWALAYPAADTDRPGAAAPLQRLIDWLEARR